MRIYLLVFLWIISSSLPVYALGQATQVKRGNDLFKKGDFAQSLQSFQNALKNDPESPLLNYNAGTAYYKLNHWDQAIPAFEKGLLSEDNVIKKNSHFNLGNSYYQRSKQFESMSPETALKDIQKSKEHFESVLKMDDKDSEARYNYEAALKKEEEIKKKIKQMPLTKKKGTDKDKAYEDQDNHQAQPQKQDQESSGASAEQQHDSSPEENQTQNQDAQDQNHNEKESLTQGNEAHNDTIEDQSAQNTGAQNAGEHKSEGSEKRGVSYKPGELTKEEAQKLLRQFEQNEEPAGLLKMQKQTGQERPVLKDW